MVTRNIEKDTATQVNANLIGVLVHPDTNIKVSVDDIVVDYTYTKFVITNSVPKPGHPDEYVGGFTDAKNNVYWSTDEIFSIETENSIDTYIKCILWPQTDTSDDNGVWLKYPNGNIPEPYSPLFKIDRTDSANPVITEMDSYFATFFLEADMVTFMKIGEAAVYSPVFGLDYNDMSLNYFVNGDFLLHNGYKVGYVVSGPEVVTEPNVTFTKGNVEEELGYQTWTNNDDEAFGPRVLYTPTDFPAVGDKALFTLFLVKDEYNPQTIKAINKTETPVTDPVNCKLSYSVDGSTWTDLPENITEDNNVIANIPRYMYLKFSQDVVITVE